MNGSWRRLQQFAARYGLAVLCVAAPLVFGAFAPDFALRSHDGREITLSSFRGQTVVLAFFAFAFTNT